MGKRYKSRVLTHGQETQEINRKQNSMNFIIAWMKYVAIHTKQSLISKEPTTNFSH